MGIFQDLQLLLPGLPGAQSIGGIQKSIHMNASGHQDRQQHKRSSPHGVSKAGKALTDRIQKYYQKYAFPSCKSTPITTPINGKKHIIYRIFSLSQSALGTGILENMANAIKKLFQIFFIMTQFPPAFLFLPAEWSRPLPPPHPPVLPVHSSSLPNIADNV